MAVADIPHLGASCLFVSYELSNRVLKTRLKPNSRSSSLKSQLGVSHYVLPLLNRTILTNLILPPKRICSFLFTILDVDSDLRFRLFTEKPADILLLFTGMHISIIWINGGCHSTSSDLLKNNSRKSHLHNILLPGVGLVSRKGTIVEVNSSNI